MIIYSAIARASDGVVLVDCSDPLFKGNVGLAAIQLFGHLRDHPECLPKIGEHSTWVQHNDPSINLDELWSNFLDGAASVFNGTKEDIDQHFFHLYHKKGVIYLCIGDDADLKDQKVNFACLDQLEKDFTRLHRKGLIDKAHAYAMEKTFQQNMRGTIVHFNVNHDKFSQDRKVAQLMTQVADLKTILGRNINILLEKSDNIEELVNRSNELEHDAKVFYRKSKYVRIFQQRRYICYFLVKALLVTTIVVVLGLILTFGICGANLSRCKASHYSNNGGAQGNYNGGQQQQANNNGGHFLRY